MLPLGNFHSGDNVIDRTPSAHLSTMRSSLAPSVANPIPPIPMNKTLQIQIFSYWHTGSGMGKGPELDATVIRDSTGLPYLPGRTIKGLLREALLTCEQLGHIPEQ